MTEKWKTKGPAIYTSGLKEFCGCLGLLISGGIVIGAFIGCLIGVAVFFVKLFWSLA